VSPVSQTQTDSVRDSPISDREDIAHNEFKQQAIDIKFTNTSIEQAKKERQCPEMIIEPPTPPIEKRHDFEKASNNLDNTNSAHRIEISDEIKMGHNLEKSEVVQTQESYQHGQHNSDGHEAKKMQETVQLTEREEESLYEKFPPQEEKQVKQKLKRRVSKKSSVRKFQNSTEINEDKIKEDEKLDNEANLEKHTKNTESREQRDDNTTQPSRSKSQIRKKPISTEENNIELQEYKSLSSNFEIPLIKIQTQDALEGLYADPIQESTSDVGKVRMQGDKQHESIHEKKSVILAKNVENVESDIAHVIDPDDIVHEILGSCSQVKEILSRIMDNKVESDDEDQDECIPSTDDNQINKSEMSSQNLPGIEETPIDLVENIADLTVDKVKEYLQLEEQANEILKKELEETKKRQEKEKVNNLVKEKIEQDKSKESKFVSQLNNGNSLTNKKSSVLGDAHISKPNRVPEMQAKERTRHVEQKAPQYASKKEHQIAKIKDFLKDPNSSKTEEVQLDVRLKKTDLEKEESSKEITKILDFLYIGSYTAIKEKDMSREGINSVIEISNYQNLTSFNDVLHIRHTEESVTLQNTFEQIADKVENTKKSEGKILIACEESTGLSATMCVPFLIKYEKMSPREAVKMIEKKRPQAKLHAGIILRIEEWEGRLHGRKLSGGFSSLVASWLPMVFVIILGYLLFKKIFEIVDKNHDLEKRTDSDIYMQLYEYFDVRKWP